jgi:hypothetical protein
VKVSFANTAREFQQEPDPAPGVEVSDVPDAESTLSAEVDRRGVAGRVGAIRGDMDPFGRDSFFFYVVALERCGDHDVTEQS